MKKFRQILFFSFLLVMPLSAYCAQKSKIQKFPVAPALNFLLQYRENTAPVGGVIASMKRQGFHVEREDYEGDEGGDRFYAVLTGRFKILVLCNVDDGPTHVNEARVKSLNIPIDKNNFELTEGTYDTHGKFVRGKPVWYKYRPLVLKKILANLKVTGIIINTPDPDQKASKKTWQAYSGYIVQEMEEKLGKPNAVTFTWPPEYGEDVFTAEWKAAKFSCALGDDEDGLNIDGIRLTF